MRYLPNGVTKLIGRQLLQAQKNSPTLLFGAGLVGVVATAVLASKATLKLEGTLQDIQLDREAAKTLLERPNEATDDYTESDYRKDMVLLHARGAAKVGRLYAPALAVGVVSVACLTGSHHILSQRNVGLTAAYAALEKGFDEYRQRVAREVGEDKELELRYNTEDQIVSKDGKKVKTRKVPSSTGHSVYARFFDEYCKSWSKVPEYNAVFVRCQQNYANDLLKARGHVFLNEIYDMLGIERSKAGAVVGWVIGDNGDNFIDFGLYDDRPGARDFVNGREGSILLDFNVDGVIYDLI